MPKTPSMLAAVLFGSIGLLWTGTVSSIQGLPFPLPPGVTIQLMPPIKEDNPGNTDVTGAQIIFANPGPNTLADYNTILRLPPIKSAAVPERHRNRLAIVAGNKEGSTFLHFEAPELWLGEHHYAEVIFLAPLMHGPENTDTTEKTPSSIETS